MKKVLVVGQTPPPYGGQAVMVKTLLDGSYTDAELVHVRMHFSKEMDQMGRFAFAKLAHLIQVVLKVVYHRLVSGTDVLYYPPSTPDRYPMLRDLAILCATRWMFRKTIFHFHAAGLSEAYPGLPRLARPFFRLAYCRPDLAIHLSGHNPRDGEFLQAARNCTVPNGIADEYRPPPGYSREIHAVCKLLFVGLIRESKGIFVLVDAMRILAGKGLPVSVTVVGQFESPELERDVRKRIDDHLLGERFEFTGVLTGDEKHRVFMAADVFCFPSFIESFGLVVAEAMQFELPVVASRAGGVQSLVVDGETGYLTGLGDSTGMAERIERLARDPELRRRMGRQGRARYLREYTIERFHERMDHCFSLIDREA